MQQNKTKHQYLRRDLVAEQEVSLTVRPIIQEQDAPIELILKSGEYHESYHG